MRQFAVETQSTRQPRTGMQTKFQAVPRIWSVGGRYFEEEKCGPIILGPLLAKIEPDLPRLALCNLVPCAQCSVEHCHNAKVSLQQRRPVADSVKDRS